MRKIQKEVIDQMTASKSARVMRTQRGMQPQHIKARKIDRALTRSRKAQNRYCNNLDKNGKVKKVA